MSLIGDLKTRALRCIHRRRKSSPDPKSQRGQVLVWIVFMLPVFMALVGLVFDGGLMWVRYRRASWAADAAAVAAASEIDPRVYRDKSQVLLREDAIYTAMHYAQKNDPNLHVTSVYVQDNVVYVRGWVYVETYFLKMIGVEGANVNIKGRERPAWGISEREQ